MRALRAYYRAVRRLDPHREWSNERVNRWVWRHPRGFFTPVAVILLAAVVLTAWLTLWAMSLVLGLMGVATGLAALAAWLDPALADR